MDLACSSTGVIHILSSFQGVHFTHVAHGALRLSWKNHQWVRICSLALKLLLSFLNLLLKPHLLSGLCGAPAGGAPGTNPADGDQGTSCLDDTSHQQPLQVSPSFTSLGTLGGERPRTSLLWRQGADGLALGSIQSLLLQELPVSLSLAIFPLSGPLLDEPCKHPVGLLLGSRVVKGRGSSGPGGRSALWVNSGAAV